METSLFASEPVNTGRQVEFDLSRTIACILMVFCHVGIYLFSSTNHPRLHLVFDLLGSEFSAPVFMALLGACLSFSRDTSPRRLARRGIELLTIGLLLNFVRRSVPCWFLLGHGVNPPDSFPVHPIFDVDILLFAGLAILAFAITKHLALPALTVFLGSIPLVVLGEVLWGIHPGNPFGDFFCNLLWFGTDQAYFPFLHWFFFAAFGNLLGVILTRCADKNTFYRLLFLPSLLGVLTVYALLWKDGGAYYFKNCYYSMGLREAVLATNFILFSLAFSHILFPKIPEGMIRRAIFRYSRNLTAIYCISWVLIFFILTGGLYMGHTFAVWEVLLLMPLVFVVSDGLAAFYKSFSGFTKRATRV